MCGPACQGIRPGVSSGPAHGAEPDGDGTGEAEDPGRLLGTGPRSEPVRAAEDSVLGPVGQDDQRGDALGNRGLKGEAAAAGPLPLPLDAAGRGARGPPDPADPGPGNGLDPHSGDPEAPGRH